MRRARVVGALAVAAGLAAVPAAMATPGHAPKVRYDVVGVATSYATSTLGLTNVTYHPTSLGTSTALTVNLTSASKYANRRDRPIAQARIAPGDLIEVKWVEPNGSTPSTADIATEVVDLGHAPAIRYDVTGIAGTTAPTTTLALSDVTYHPSSLGTSATLSVSLGGSTKYGNGHGKAIAESKISSGDRIEVVWVEPATTTPSTALDATRVIDLGPPPPAHFFARGVADAAATCTVSLTLDNTHFWPTSIGTKGAQFTVHLATSTKFTGRWGRPLACASIKKGDHVEVAWTEPAGSSFSSGLTATRVTDTSRGRRH